LRPGTKWLAIFREPVGTHMTQAWPPDNPGVLVQHVRRAGTEKELSDVVYKTLKQGYAPDRLVMGKYTDDKRVLFRLVPDSWIELLSPKDRPTVQGKASL